MLLWNASPTALSYRIYFGTLPTQTKTNHEGAYDTNEQTFTLTGLPYGMPTYCTVTARNEWGESAESATVSATPVAPLSPPAAPTGVTVLAGNAQVTVSFSAVEGATSYNVYYGTSTQQTKANHGAVATNFTSGSAITGLINDTLYYFAVTAVGPGGESLDSNSYATMPLAPPAAPANVVAVAGNAQVALSWTAVAGAVSYNVYYGTSATQTKASHDATSFTGDALATIGGLTNGATYYFSVTAGNSSGLESAESVTISAVPHLPIPTGVAVAAGSGQVTITWTAVPFASSYNLYQATATGVTPANGTKVESVTSPFVRTGLTNGTTYYFVVTEVMGGLESPASAEVSATPSLPIVQGVTAVAGNTQVTIDWTVIAGASSYNLYYSTTDGVTAANGTKVTDATRPYVLTGLANNTTYYFIVTEITGGAESAASLQQTATPTLPSPGYVVAIAGVGQVTVNWNGVVGATGYNLYYSSDAGVTPATGTKVTDTPKPATVTGLINGTKYYFIVTAVFPSGESAPSSLLGVSSATPLAPPSAPTGLVVTAAGQQITLTWEAATGATMYKVYRSLSPSVAVNLDNLYFGPLSGTTYTDLGVVEGRTYFYVVTGVNAVAEGEASNEASGTTAPSRPEGLTATGGVGQVLLSWTSSMGASEYSLYRSLVQWFTLDAAHRIAVGIGGTTYTDTGVEAGMLYYYVATASNAAGESIGSVRAIGPTAPLAPASLDAVGGVAQITLTWPLSPGATRYDLYYSTSTGVTPGTGTLIGSVTSPYTHARPNAGTYYYVVTATNVTAQGPASTEASAIALPLVPASVRAVGGVGQNVVTWANVAGANTYNLYWSTTSGVTTANGTLIAGVTSPYAHTSLSNGTPHFYVLTTQQGSFESPASGEVTATPAPGGSWAAGTNMPVANWGMAGTELGGKIYIFGGYPTNMSADTYVFDPGVPSWTKKASMTVARRMACAAAAGNVIYVIGGEGANSASLAVVEAYDTIQDTWSTKAPLPGADSRPSCAAVAGVVYVMSGSQTFAYDQANDAWTPKAAAPTARTQGAAVAVGGIIYKLGGSANPAACYGNARTCPIVEAYDPGNDSWSTKAPMPTARTPLAATAINGIIYAIGGYGLSGAVLATEAYDPASDVWTTKAPIAFPRIYSFAATVGGSAYVMGANSSEVPSTSVETFTP